MRSVLTKSMHLFSRTLLPKRMRLAGLYHTYLLDSPEPELVYLDQLLRQHRRTAIDVGANVGYWTYKLASLFEQVVSVEMNEDCYRYIDDAQLANVRLLKHGLSNQESNVSFYLPVYDNGFISHGWGTVEAERQENLFKKVLERTYLVKPLDNYALTDVDFIKIDVEGHELSVIDGAMETIRLNKPTLIVEASEATIGPLNDRLLPMGYRQYTMVDLLGTAGGEGNYIFLR